MSIGWISVAYANGRTGPRQGAIARGARLESPEQRDVVTVGMNLLVGAAALTRAGWLRAQGVVLPAEAGRVTPHDQAELDALRKRG